MDADVTQFEAIYDTHVDAIFRHLAYRLGDKERAKELTQEVFMRTWQHLAAGGTLTYPKAFLYKIANNLFINEIRTDKKTHSLDELREVAGYEVPDSQADVGFSAEQAEVLRFLEELPEQHREILTMRYLDGLPVSLIAEVLEQKENTISMRIARALDHLKTKYGHQQSP